MKRILFIIAILLAIFLNSCANKNPNEPNQEENQLKLYITPPNQSINLNEETNFEVKIDNVENLFALSMEITFDNDKISCNEDDVTISDSWGNQAISEVIKENGKLNICIGLQQTAENDYLNGSFTLFSFKLKGISIGTSDIVIQNLRLIDENGEPVKNFSDLEISNAILNIGD